MLFRSYNVEYVTWRDGRWDKPEVATACIKKADLKGISGTPTFWVEGSNDVYEGYDQKQRAGFTRWLEGVFRAIVAVPRAALGIAGAVGGTANDACYEQHRRHSAAQLMPMPSETVLYSGHGPATTVAIEKAANPFLRPEFKRTA